VAAEAAEVLSFMVKINLIFRARQAAVAAVFFLRHFLPCHQFSFYPECHIP
jgi:hypothetical protein